MLTHDFCFVRLNTFQNGKAVWLVCKTAMSLSFGTLLADGEWEILTVLASYMGPAEGKHFQSGIATRLTEMVHG